MTPKKFHKKFPSVHQINSSCAIDMACPACGNRGPFFVEVKTFVELTDEDGYGPADRFEELEGSMVECGQCGSQGSDFLIEGLDEHLSKIAEKTARKTAKRQA